MAEEHLTDTEQKVLSYCSRGTPTQTAIERISGFFGMSQAEVSDALRKLRGRGLVIETRIASVTAYTTNPLKVKRAMINEAIVEQVAAKERGAKAGGFKRVSFANPEPKPIQTKPAKKESRGTFDFDVE